MRPLELQQLTGDRMALSRIVTKNGIDTGANKNSDQSAIDDLYLARLARRMDDMLSYLDRAIDNGIFFQTESETNVNESRLIRNPKPALPDPRLVRKIIKQRMMRGGFLNSELFADPAWNMLLDLTAARAEHRRVSVTSLCIASGVPSTTALRWIKVLEGYELVERQDDEVDARRAFIVLTDKGTDAMARYFQAIGRSASRIV